MRSFATALAFLAVVSAQERNSRESKEQNAEAALAEARQAHNETLKRAEQAMAELEGFLKKVEATKEANATFDEAQKRASQIVADSMEEAHEALKKRVASLAQPGAVGPPVDKLAMGAVKAADEVQKVNVKRAKEMRGILGRMEHDDKKTARALRTQATHAARKALKAARALERAERHAGTKEKEYEGNWLDNERTSERMEDRAEDLGGKAEDSIERFFERVRDKMDSSAKLVQEAEGLGQSVQSAEQQGRAALEKAKEAAGEAAGEAPEEAAPAKGGPPKSGSAGGSREHAPEEAHSGDGEAAAGGKDDEGASREHTPVQSATALSRRVGSKSTAMPLFAMAVVLSAGVALAYVQANARRPMREPPLLG